MYGSVPTRSLTANGPRLGWSASQAPSSSLQKVPEIRRRLHGQLSGHRSGRKLVSLPNSDAQCLGRGEAGFCARKRNGMKVNEKIVKSAGKGIGSASYI